MTERLSGTISDEEKIARFDKAYKILSDLAFKAPEIRPPNAVTLERLGLLICNGQEQDG